MRHTGLHQVFGIKPCQTTLSPTFNVSTSLVIQVTGLNLNKSNPFCHCGVQQFLIAESHPVEEVCPPRPLVADGCHARVHRLPRPHACAREGDLPKRRRTSRRWERPNLKRLERFQPRTNSIFLLEVVCLLTFFGGKQGVENMHM